MNRLDFIPISDVEKQWWYPKEKPTDEIKIENKDKYEEKKPSFFDMMFEDYQPSNVKRWWHG